ncbi:hypothetical protein ACFQNJ_15995 [Hydrogenophaga bisanensis]|uniref:Uncharacterized protein n=1 Tax=Hydrogenophaga bisanensis TaxID=439611 RepID=A0ABW2RD24_9BURK
MAAQQYARFKSLMLSIAALLRKAQRDNSFSSEADYAILQRILKDIGRDTAELLQSNVPAAIVEIAEVMSKQSETSLLSQSRRYYEYALSSLFYDLATVEVVLEGSSSGSLHDPGMHRRLVLLRLLHGLYSLVKDIDDLIVEANSHEKVMESLSEFGVKFLLRALQVAQINRGIWLGNDFQNFRRAILENIDFAGSLECKPLEVVDEQFGENGVGAGGLFLALHESGHAESVSYLMRLLKRKGYNPLCFMVGEEGWRDAAESASRESVPIFFVSDSVESRILEVKNFIDKKRSGDKEKSWTNVVIVIDQVDQFLAVASNKYLSMGDSFDLWCGFFAINHFLESLRNDRRDLEAVRRVSNAKIDNDENFRSIERAVNYARSSLPKFQVKKMPGGDRGELVVETLKKGGIKAGLVVDESVSLKCWYSACNDILSIYCGDVEDGFLRTLCERLLHKEFRLNSFERTVATLAERPLLERPIYDYAPVVGGLYDQPIDFHFNADVKIFGVAYLDSRFVVNKTGLVEMLAAKNSVYSLF